MKHTIDIRLTRETKVYTDRKTKFSELKIEINESVNHETFFINCKTTLLRIKESSFKTFHSSLKNFKRKKIKWVQLPLFP